MSDRRSFLAERFDTAGCGVAPVSKEVGLSYRSVQMLIAGKMHATPEVMDRLLRAIEKVKADREAG